MIAIPEISESDIVSVLRSRFEYIGCNRNVQRLFRDTAFNIIVFSPHYTHQCLFRELRGIGPAEQELDRSRCCSVDALCHEALCHIDPTKLVFKHRYDFGSVAVISHCLDEKVFWKASISETCQQRT